MLDTTTEWGRLVERRLREEEVIWLTTVRRDGQPQPIPVWFLWDGETILIYSRPDQQKVRNIRHNPKVSLHFNTDEYGDSVVRIDDNGRGFAFDDDTGGEPITVGAAPRSLRERVRAMDGRLELKSSPKGASVTIDVPLEAAG